MLADCGSLLDVGLPVIAVPVLTRRTGCEDEEELGLERAQALEDGVGQRVRGSIDDEIGTLCLDPHATAGKGLDEGPCGHSTTLRLSWPAVGIGAGGEGLYPS